MSSAESGHFTAPFKGKDGKWYFNLKASNNEIVMASEGYETEEGARAGISAAVRAVMDSTQAEG